MAFPFPATSLIRAPAPSPPPATVQQSPWNSPVPYLFGGLAAMLGLIAFALLILACSYWNISGAGDTDDGGHVDGGHVDVGDLESGDSKPGNMEMEPPVFEEKFVVIMAGEVKPTFLATLISGGGYRRNLTEMEENNREPSDQIS